MIALALHRSQLPLGSVIQSGGRWIKNMPPGDTQHSFSVCFCIHKRRHACMQAGMVLHPHTNANKRGNTYWKSICALNQIDRVQQLPFITASLRSVSEHSLEVITRLINGAGVLHMISLHNTGGYEGKRGGSIYC